VLHLTDQLWLADLLGYARGGRLLTVEHMMRLHYEKTLHVYQMVELTISRLRGLGHVGRRRILIKTRRRIDDDFTAIDGKVYLRDRELWRKDDLGLRLFRMCRTAQVRGLRISFELQREIAGSPHAGRFAFHVLSDTDEEFLFDQQSDPLELENRIADPAQTEVLNSLRTALTDWMKEIGDRPYPHPAPTAAY